MNYAKRGEVAVLLTLVLMIVAGAILFLGEEGITGAVVGVDVGNLSLPVEDVGSMNGSFVNANESVINNTIIQTPNDSFISNLSDNYSINNHSIDNSTYRTLPSSLVSSQLLVPLVFGDSLFRGEYNLSQSNINFTAFSKPLNLNDDSNFATTILVTDFNNDGIKDIVTTGLNGYSRVYVFYGRENFNKTTNKSLADLTYYFDSTVGNPHKLATGDINGDGISDIILGFGNGVKVIFGSTTPNSTMDFSSNANFTFIDTCSETNYPYCNVASGDINNDTFDDVIIGNSNDGTSQSGAVYVFYGRPFHNETFNRTNANITVYGAASSDFLTSVASADLNNDSVDDLIVAAPKADPFYTNDGAVYIFYSNISMNATYTISTANVTLEGRSNSNSFAGDTLAVGDVNGDKISDLLIGVYQATEPALTRAGKVRIVYGSNAALLSNINLNTQSNSTFTGDLQVSGMQAGRGLNIGDYNNDGISDILIGAFNADVAGNSAAGKTYLIYGSSNILPILNSSVANITLDGLVSSDNTGKSISVGDINNDNYPDLLISSSGGIGKIYVLYGKPLCGVLNKNTTLYSNLSTTGKCFEINTSNVVLDGNNYVVSGSGSALGLNISSSSNVVVKNIKIQSFGTGVYLEKSSINSNFYNSSILNNTYLDINVSDNGGTNNLFTNVTFNRSRTSIGTSSDITVRWYINTYVNDSSGNPLANFNISAYNVTGGLEQNVSTSTAGNTLLTLIEYKDYAGTKIYNTNHTVNFNRTLYTSSTFNINLTATNNTLLTSSANLSCGDLSSSTTFSPVQITVHGTCFTASSNNIVVDGAGVTVIGDTTGAGFNLTSVNNITIKNFRLINFSQGIAITASNNSNFTNITLLSSTNHDIFVANQGGVNNSFNNVTFDRSKTFVGTNSNLVVNQFVTFLTRNVDFLLADATITVKNSSNSQVASNTTGALGQVQLMLREYHEDNATGRIYDTPYTITLSKTNYVTGTDTINLTQMNSSTVTESVLASFSCGSITTNTVFQTNNASTTIDPNAVSTGCITIGGPTNIVIDGNNSIITGNGTSNGFYILSANNITLKRFKVQNFTHGLKLSSSNNVTLYNFVIYNNTYGINFSSSSQGSVIDSNISSITNDVGVYSSTNELLINVTMNKNRIISGDDTSLIMKWYAFVTVNNSVGGAVASANVSAYKADGTLETSLLTNTNGTIRLTLSEFSKNSAGFTYITPHLIKVTLPGYFVNSTTVDVSATNNTALNFTLSQINCQINLSNNITIGLNMLSNNTCFTVASDNLIINGNNYTIIGNGSGNGLDINNRNGLSVDNINLINFTEGINLYNTTNSYFNHMNLRNNTYGVFFNTSNNNTVANTQFGNNTFSVFAINDGGTNNTLLNVSVDINNITVSGTATVYLKWYAYLNVTYGSSHLPLQNANVSGYMNISNAVMDHSLITDQNGLARLELTELKKNSSGVYYMTPHNITAFYSTSLSGFAINSTSINLSQTNSTVIKLNLNVNCTTPSLGLNVNTSINLCPGTFDIGGGNILDVTGSNLTISCENTKIIASSGYSELVLHASGPSLNQDIGNVTILNCNFNRGISSYSGPSYNDITINSSVLGSLSLQSANRLILRNSYIGGFSATGCGGINNSIIENGTINGTFSNIASSSCGILPNATNNTFNKVNFIIYSSPGSTSYGMYFQGINNTVKNSTFSRSDSSTTGYSIYLLSGTGNQFYYNTFLGTMTSETYITTDGNYFNTSVSNKAQGNLWPNICSLNIADSNSDGYGDSGSDYPYNATHTSKFTGFGSDFGPIIPTCPSSTASGASSTAAATTSVSGGSAPAAPAAAPTAPTAAAASSSSSEFYNAKDVQKYLKSDSFETKKVDGITQVTFTLENTGTQPMQLFPNILQEVDDPFFIVTRKTLGGENSKFTDIASLSYSDTPVAGRLLKATIVNPENIVLQPGEKTEKTIQIKEGLANPHQLKIQFTTLGESVLEKDVKVEKKVISGTAVDVDTENHLMDIYAVLVPEKALAQKDNTKSNEQKSDITGAVVGVPANNNNIYYLELSMNDINTNTTSFADLYGPYNLKQGQSFIFAQQVKYDPLIYHGNYNLQTKIIKAGTILVKNDLGVELKASTKKTNSLAWPINLTLLFFLVVVLIIALYLIYWHERKNY